MAEKSGSKVERMILKIPFIMRKDEGKFVAECIDLNIVTQGDTLKEARQNVMNAITLHLKSADELGMLDEELEKLGVIKKKNKLEMPQRELESVPVEIPC